MPILRLEIDDIKYEVECKEGEEKLLRESEQLLNNKFEQNKQIKNLMYRMLLLYKKRGSRPSFF